MKKTYIALYILMFLFIYLTNIITINATENNINFGVAAIIPENQVDKSKSYFDLMMKPGDVQEITIKIFNSNKERKTFDINLVYATTSNSGLIDYTVDDISKKDESLDISLTEIASNYPKEVQIDANSEYDLKITLTMPEEEFDGVVLGGVNISQRLEDDPKQEIMINNQYSYVIGIILRENNNKISPNLHLKDVKPDMLNYRRVISANIQNSEATLIKDLELAGKVFDNNSNSNVPVLEFNKENFSVAPNSNFNFIMHWGNEDFVPGNYRLSLKATSENHHWEWDEEFTIDAKKSEEINRNSILTSEISRVNTGINYLLIGLVITLLIIIVILIIKLSKSKK